MRSSPLDAGRGDRTGNAAASAQGRGSRLLIAVVVVIVVWAGGIEQAHAAASTPTNPQRSELEARAALLPLAAIMVCSRVCPVAGVAAARIIRRTPKQIRPIRAPNPAAATAFSRAAGSSPGTALGNALAKGNARVAAAWRARRYNAHHIVAVDDHRAEFARMVLRLHGIGPNSAVNGAWLHVSLHSKMHTNAYYANVNAVMAKYYWDVPRPTSELVADLNRIGQLLQRGQLPL